MNARRIENEVKAILNENKMSYDWSVDENGKVYIRVVNGDWKHDHAYLRMCMGRKGYAVVERNIEETEITCDAFTADYVFSK